MHIVRTCSDRWNLLKDNRTKQLSVCGAWVLWCAWSTCVGLHVGPVAYPEFGMSTKSGVRYLLSTQAGYDHNYNSFDSESAAIAVEELRQLEQSHAVNPLPLSNGYVVPVISTWRKNEDNSVTGIVLGDSIVTDDREDNDVVTITTSPIVKGQFEKGCIIETAAGTR